MTPNTLREKCRQICPTDYGVNIAAPTVRPTPWQLVPLWGVIGDGCECGRVGCKSAGKHPRRNAWQHHTVDNRAAFDAFRRRHPAANWGVLLSPSGIVDVEFDAAEGADTARELLAGIVTPSYESARSVHRLFRAPDGWSPSVAVTNWRGLEIRTGTATRAAQSVIPPSVHHSGRRYRYLSGLGPRVPLAVLPAAILAATNR
tara:strand:- start:8606 stop:9211 length:606 start_codon:yes stop_codon:yes gene_type:complete